MNKKIKKVALVFVFSFCFLISGFFSAFGQNGNFQDQFRDYLTRFGFSNQNITSDADRAIRAKLVQFIGHGDINLDELPPERLNALLADPAWRERFVNDFSTFYQNGALPEARYSPPVRSRTSTLAEDVDDPTKEEFQLFPANCFGKGDSLSSENKDYGECGWKDIIALLNRMIKFMAYIAASLSAIAFAYAGFLYMTAAGNSGKIEQAHGIFKKTFIGIFFVLVGYLLVATILKTLVVKNTSTLLDISGTGGLGGE